MKTLNEDVEVGGLRHLSEAEVDSVGGGVVVCLAVAVVGSVIGAAVYDAFEEEIGAAVEAVGEAIADAGRAMQD